MYTVLHKFWKGPSVTAIVADTLGTAPDPNPALLAAFLLCCGTTHKDKCTVDQRQADEIGALCDRAGRHTPLGTALLGPTTANATPI